MKENVTFIDNFYGKNVGMELSMEKTHQKLKAIVGIHGYMEPNEIKRNVISEIFKAMMIHDKILIRTVEILDLIGAFGLADTIFLIQTNKLEFVDDEGATISLTEVKKDKYSISLFRNANDSGQIMNSLEWLEKRLSKNKTHSENLKNVLLINAEKYNKPIDTNLIDQLIVKETQYDILNTNVSNYLNLNTTSTEDIYRSDAYNFLRLSALNKTLIYSSILSVDNMVVDGAIKSIIGAKLSPTMNNISSSINLFDSFFRDVFQKKNIPDLADLYLRKIITINDYFEIISKLGGERFRQWIMDKDYDPAELEKDLINSNSKISNKYVKFIKWTLPNAVGLILPAVGISASFVDSYILDKLSTGWHPNLFLDDILKRKIDNKIELHAKEERIASIKSRFPSIGRNDLCPCGSRKKFKQCCGE